MVHLQAEGVIFAKTGIVELVHPQAQAYAEAFTSNPSPLLQELLDATLEQHPKSHMISGHWQGRLLQFISCAVRPRRILEIGTFTGYSALCLAEGLTEDGILHTIESRQNDADTAASFFSKSPLGNKIKLHVGDAHELLLKLKENWDLVFLDADKTGYCAYLQAIWPELKSNALVIADNVLFHGEVLKPELKGKNPKALQQFNEMVRDLPGAEQVLLPVRDGLMLIRKK